MYLQDLPTYFTCEIIVDILLEIGSRGNINLLFHIEIESIILDKEILAIILRASEEPHFLFLLVWSNRIRNPNYIHAS